MTAAAAPLSVHAPVWEAVRRLYPLYWAMCSRFGLGEPCAAIEAGDATPAAAAAASAWLDQMDALIEPHHLRQVLQTTNYGTEPVLRALITRILDRETKLENDGAKLDFLLVQYFAIAAPPEFFQRDITLEEVATLLEPVLGESSTVVPAWLEPLEQIIAELHQCKRLRDLLDARLVERARALKQAAGEMSYGSVALLEFTRFNFHARNTFFRILQQEIREISAALDHLEKIGTTRIDGRAAGLSEHESTVTLRNLVWEWKRPTRAAYSEAAVLEQLAQLRAITDTLIAPPPAPEPEPPAIESAPERVMESTPAPAEAEPAAAASDALQSCLEQIAELLLENPRAMAATSVDLNGTRISMAPWEIAAFIRGGDDTSDVLQRAVAARALLTVAPPADRPAFILAARAEAEQIQACAALARQTKNLEAAVNLAASGKRLLAAIEAASAPANPAPRGDLQ